MFKSKKKGQLSIGTLAFLGILLLVLIIIGVYYLSSVNKSIDKGDQLSEFPQDYKKKFEDVDEPGSNINPITPNFTASITSPSNNSDHFLNHNINFKIDYDNNSGPIVCNWDSNIDAVFENSSCDFIYNSLSLGDHQISLEVSDNSSTVTDNISISIESPTTFTASILNPQDNQVFGLNEDINLEMIYDNNSGPINCTWDINNGYNSSDLNTQTSINTAGIYKVELQAEDTGSGNIINDEVMINIVVNNPCPQNYVFVPNNPLYDTGDFCVMKYEAKMDDNGDGIGDTTGSCRLESYNIWKSRSCPYNLNNRTVVSTAKGFPIGWIAKSEATSACSSLGLNYHLVTNEEWMTIARNIEENGNNWTGGIVGVGSLKVGNNGGFCEVASACYNGPDPDYGLGRNELAKFVLSNGSEIWDLSGNMAEWVNQNLQEQNMPRPRGQTLWFENLYSYGTLGRKSYAPINNDFNTDHGIGSIFSYYYPNSSEVRSFFRGAHWRYGRKSGIFAVNMTNHGYIYNQFIGFRCSTEPITFTASILNPQDNQLFGLNEDINLEMIYDNNSGPINCTWDINNGGGSYTDCNQTITINNTGTYKVELEVEDTGSGNIINDEVIVSIFSASILNPQDNQLFGLNEDIDLEMIYDNNSAPINCTWDINNGGGSYTDCNTQISINTPGTYKVELQAEDTGSGNIINDEVIIDVQCECSSGPCCSDSCHFDAAGIQCDSVAQSFCDPVGCSGVHKSHSKKAYCSGDSSACDDWGDWGEPTIIEQCTQYESCSTGADECVCNGYCDPGITTIDNCSDLQEMNECRHYEILDDIDCSMTNTWNEGKGFDPVSFIGLLTVPSPIIISDLYIDRPSEDNVGLFGHIPGSLNNITLSNVDIKGYNDVGAFIGNNLSYSSHPDFNNCSVSGSISGNNHVGGFLGYGCMNFRNSTSSTTIQATGNRVGGFVGTLGYRHIVNSSFTGEVSGNDEVGGLIGHYYMGRHDVIKKSFVNGSVSGNNGVGGLIGDSSFVIRAFIRQSYFSGDISGTDNVGGLVGKSTGPNDFQINFVNSYVTGSIIASGDAGGIISHFGTDFRVDCYDTFWDVNTTGLLDSGGDNCIPKTTPEMKQESTFTDWNFDSCWLIENGSSYPYLQNNEEIPHPQ